MTTDDLSLAARALAVVLGWLLVVEPLIGALPLGFLEKISPFMPGTAGGRLLMTSDQLALDLPNRVDLSAWQGYGVLVLWTVVLLTLGALLLKRRDA